MSIQPKVSIITISYNQEKYIQETLESLIRQKADFAFEVIVGDDNSKDGTRAIIEKYAKAHPQIIRPIFRNKNLGSWPNFLDTLRTARGDYVAICEGDDYWTDPAKLQTQVDFMEKHPDYSVCFHKVKIIYEDEDREDQVYPDVEDSSWYTGEELLRTNYIQTNSVLYRRQDYKDMPTGIMPGDWYLHIYHASFGKIKFIDKVMSVYRKHPGGIWRDYDLNKNKIWQKYGIAHITMWMEAAKLYRADQKASDIIGAHINNVLDALIGVDEQYGSELLREALAKFPDTQELFMIYLHKQLERKSAEYEELKAELLSVGDERNALAYKHNATSQELSEITNSKTWRLRTKTLKAIKKKEK